MISAPVTNSPGIRRVLMVAHALNVAGAAVHMRTLGEGLMAKGIEVAIVVRETNPGATRGLEWFQEAGFTVFTLPFPGYGANGRNLKRLLKAVPGFDKLLQSWQPDIVHVHAPTLCLVARRPCRKQGIPIVTTFNIWPDGKNKQRIARWSNRLFLAALGDRCIAISSEMGRDMHERLGIPKAHIRMIHHGVDANHFRPPSPEERSAARAALGVSDSRLVIAMPAVLDPRKNHALLIDALAELKQRHLPVTALCAGEGRNGFDEQLTVAAGRQGVTDSFRLIGYHDSRELYWASDVCVLPSLNEGFGLVIVEAMFCGLVPIRTPAQGAADQIRDGENGYIIAFHDPHILADRLARLTEDTALRRRLGQNALASAEQHFTLDRMVEQTLDVYGQALRDRT